ncbi:MAG TPA: YceI family protein [Candidatus Limnocylindria bacterium]|nr:YceI family protein [Candidatus Limnocylindria bacterium]
MSRRSPLALAGLVVLGGAAGLAFLFLRGAPPPAVGVATGSPGASLPAASVGALPTGAAGTLGPDGLDGTWTVDTSIGSFADFSSSFVGYRVDETFADNRANTAVGRTPSVLGSLILAGASITSVEITADLTQLESDDDRRDGRLRDQAIETGRFPQSTFRLTGPIELGEAPADGKTVDATATGELTLHGVTRTVIVPVQASLSGDVVTVTGSIEILFADYDFERPTSFLVLSIEDHGIMEFQLHFRRG